jgi:hypothetical protein
MALLASLRSTIAYQTTGSTISTGAIYTTLAGNVPTWSNQLTYSTLSGSTISTNTIATTSTLTGSSIILSGNMGIGTATPAYSLDLGAGTIGCNSVNTNSVTAKGTNDLLLGSTSGNWVSNIMKSNQIGTLPSSSYGDYSLSTGFNFGNGGEIVFMNNYGTTLSALGGFSFYNRTSATTNGLIAMLKNANSSYANRLTPTSYQLQIPSSVGSLNIGAFYTSGVGFASAIQSWDSSGGGVAQALLLNPLGGTVQISDNVSITGNSVNKQIRIGENVFTGFGSNNISTGIFVGRSASTGGNNILYGSSVGTSMTSGNTNALFGAGCGDALTTGFSNCGFGIKNMNFLTTGNYNTCFGNTCGNALTAGNGGNTFVGFNSGYRSTTSLNCIAIGVNTGCGTTGNENITIGADIGAGITTGIGNISVGASGTNRVLTTGNNNVSVGINAGYHLITGIGNTYLGTNAGNGSLSTATNEIVISAGTSAVAGAGNDTALIRVAQNAFYLSGYTAGGTATFGAGGQVVASSDRDTKNNITYLTNQGTIQKVLGLKPCTFELKADKNPIPKVYTGFIAQDVDEVIPTAVDGRKYKFQYEQNADHSPKVDEEGNVVYMKDADGNPYPRYLGLNTTDILATAVLAIQEQQTEITDLKAQLASLKATIDILLSKINN